MKPKVEESNFLEVINKAIAEKRHVDYLQKVKKDFKDYKNHFEQVLLEDFDNHKVYCFQAVYKRERNLWRTIEVLGNQTFNELAEAIISSMDWDNDHMHGFYFPDEKGEMLYSSPYAIFAPGWEDDPHPTFKTDEIKIGQIDFEKLPRLEFVFDFGDSHEFDIYYKSQRKPEKKEGQKDFPRLVDQKGVAPEQYPEY